MLKPFLGFYSVRAEPFPKVYGVSEWVGHASVNDHMTKFPRGGEENSSNGEPVTQSIFVSTDK